VSQPERQLGQQQANLAHLDTTMRLLDPDIRPNMIRPRQQRARSVWFRPGECLRLIYDELRDAVRPMTTRGPTATLRRTSGLYAMSLRVHASGETPKGIGFA
jgi:hypothetical protein